MGGGEEGVGKMSNLNLHEVLAPLEMLSEGGWTWPDLCLEQKLSSKMKVEESYSHCCCCLAGKNAAALYGVGRGQTWSVDRVQCRGAFPLSSASFGVLPMLGSNQLLFTQELLYYKGSSSVVIMMLGFKIHAHHVNN